MEKALAVKQSVDLSVMEQVLLTGDLKNLSAEQRVEYYGKVCQSVGLNPLTRPFDYITLNGKLTLYAKRDAADQLRSVNGISIAKPEIRFEDDLIIVTVTASDQTGRTDTDLGVVNVGNLKGEAKANAIMKAITKAKRRVTLSIAGLGWLDETEVETIPSARPVIVTEEGEIVEGNGRVVDAAVELGGQVKEVAYADLTTPKGTRLGDMTPDELRKLLAWLGTKDAERGLTTAEMQLADGVGYLLRELDEK